MQKAELNTKYEPKRLPRSFVFCAQLGAPEKEWCWSGPRRCSSYVDAPVVFGASGDLDDSDSHSATMLSFVTLFIQATGVSQKTSLYW